MRKLISKISCAIRKVLNNIRIQKWEYEYSGQDEKKVDKVTNLIIGNHFSISNGLWKGFLFEISGLGLTKAEREIMKTGFLEYRGYVNIYLFKWVISITRDTYDSHMEKVSYLKITYDKRLDNILFRLKNSLGWKCEEMYKRFYSWAYRTLKFRKTYKFTIQRSWSRAYTFEGDMLSAFQFASNYEADLMLDGKYIYSPLGLDWEDNAKAVEKYLGKGFIRKYYDKDWKRQTKTIDLKGYQNEYSPLIKNYKYA